MISRLDGFMLLQTMHSERKLTKMGWAVLRRSTKLSRRIIGTHKCRLLQEK